MSQFAFSVDSLLILSTCDVNFPQHYLILCFEIFTALSFFLSSDRNKCRSEKCNCSQREHTVLSSWVKLPRFCLVNCWKLGKLKNIFMLISFDSSLQSSKELLLEHFSGRFRVTKAKFTLSKCTW